MNIKLNNIRVNPIIRTWSSKKWVLPNAKTLMKQLMNEEIKMNRNSVHLDYPLTHPGVERAEQVVANFKRLSDSFSPTHTLAAMLLAAIVAAFVVVADQMMATWADGHLFCSLGCALGGGFCGRRLVWWRLQNNGHSNEAELGRVVSPHGAKPIR